MKVVITQSMLFPWVGLLEQIRLADVLVFYDDVQFSKGSFTNRVQVKTPTGIQWMTVPLQELKLGAVIDEVKTVPVLQWREKHLALLDRSFKGAPYSNDALLMARKIYSVDHPSIGHLARASMLALGHYFGLLQGKRILDVRDLCINGSGSQRVLDIVRAIGGTVYITGHGARNYLDHEAFEESGVKVHYMRYESQPYPQRWGEFTPYVTALDLLASLGRAGQDQIVSTSVPWREFLSRS
ncbi:MAG: hypothetical protein RIR02_420 [Pseudomonadota bacterium]